MELGADAVRAEQKLLDALWVDSVFARGKNFTPLSFGFVALILRLRGDVRAEQKLLDASRVDSGLAHGKNFIHSYPVILLLPMPARVPTGIE